MAVLTSGLSAMDLASLRAEAGEAAPSTVTLTNLVAPSPSRTNWCARSSMTLSRAAEKLFSRRSPTRPMRGAPEVPVANSSAVSLVEVSPSTVTLLKVVRTCRPSSACSTFGWMSASVTMKASMVAISGAIMPDPLAMPAIRTL